MASRISQLSALTGAGTASNDLLPIVDVSDTSMAASGTDKKITLTELQSAPVSAGTANGVLYLNGSKVATSGSALAFDGTNLGLGVTPSAWSGVGPGILELKGNAYIASTTQVLSLVTNSYFNGTNWIYKTSNPANRYDTIFGEHRWYNAPSGTAGSAITFTQAMTLDANGHLLVGKPAENVNVNGFQALSNGVFASTASFSYTGGENLILHRRTTVGNFVTCVYNESIVGAITTSGTATSYNTSSDYRLKDNQKPLTGSGEFIDALKPKTWDWKADGTNGVGFIAHEVQEVSPTSVVGEKDATRIEQYEISPAVPAVLDEEGNIVTPAVEAIMGEREVPAYQAMEYGSAEFIANIVAELQSLRKRVAALEAGGI